MSLLCGVYCNTMFFCVVLFLFGSMRLRAKRVARIRASFDELLRSSLTAVVLFESRTT